jgi:hypothetical protein
LFNTQLPRARDWLAVVMESLPHEKLAKASYLDDVGYLAREEESHP